MIMWPVVRRVLLGVAGAGLVAACSSSSSGAPGHSSLGGIRGTEIPAFSCSAAADGTARKVVASTVTRLRVCALAAPTPFNRPSKPITIRRGDLHFVQMLGALSLADLPAQEGQMCPEYAELLPKVLAEGESGALLVHLPTDGCGHLLPAVRAALGAILNAGGGGG
jgi:hypothetical protein